MLTEKLKIFLGNSEHKGIMFFLNILWDLYYVLYINRVYTAKSCPSTPKRQRCVSSAICINNHGIYEFFLVYLKVQYHLHFNKKLTTKFSFFYSIRLRRENCDADFSAFNGNI